MRKKKWKGIVSLLLVFCVVFSSVVFLQGKTAEAAAPTLRVKYGGKKYTFTSRYQSKAQVNGVLVKTPVPGLIIGGTNFVCPKVFQEESLGITYKYNKKKKVVTLSNEGSVIKVTMGSRYAKVDGDSVDMGIAAQRIKFLSKGKTYNMIPARFVMETFGYSYVWKSSNRRCVIKEIIEQEPTDEPTETASPEPTATAAPVVSTDEVRAMWISYLEFGGTAKTQEEFTSKVTTMFDKCVEYGMNTVIVQVRPFSDAMYPSSYFPWSKYVSGTMGTAPGYDPLQIMVAQAHAKGLKIQAWLNPYRITSGSTSVAALPDGHPAKIWSQSADVTENRCVLSFGGSLYYNPSQEAVKQLIINGVTEIVQNYEIDGIHFDDYFYPNLGTGYATNFDSQEYSQYCSVSTATGTSPVGIVQWRRNNVNDLVQRVYSSIKAIKPACEFGISPAGNLDNLSSNSAYYVNVATWMSNAGYVDYICPQIYWSFQNATCPYAKTVDRWAALKTNPNVKLYIGVAVYRAGTSIEAEWKNSSDVLKRQIEYGRSVSAVNGFGFYRYDSFQAKSSQSEVANLLPILK